MQDKPLPEWIPLTEQERQFLEKRCTRAVLDRLDHVSREIGRRTRMDQMIGSMGIVEALRSLARKESTSGWTDLYMNGLMGYSAEATVVESLEFRRLFDDDEIGQMEAELRAMNYEPKQPR